MELDKIRQLALKDLQKEIDKIQHSIVNLQSEIAMHKIKNYSQLRTQRKELARLLTIRREKEIISEINNGTTQAA